LHIKWQNLLQADFSVRSSGETYCAVPTKELALAVKTNLSGLNSGGTNIITSVTLLTTHTLFLAFVIK